MSLRLSFLKLLDLIKSIDTKVTKILSKYSGSIFIKIFSHLGSFLFCGIFFLLLFFLTYSKIIFYRALFAFLIVTIIVFVIKFTFKRRRVSYDKNSFYINKIDPYSFPSGHVSRLAAISFSLFDLPIFFFILTIFLFLSAVSRIARSYHYLSDCIFGAVIGFISFFLANIFLFDFIRLINLFINVQK